MNELDWGLSCQFSDTVVLRIVGKTKRCMDQVRGVLACQGPHLFLLGKESVTHQHKRAWAACLWKFLQPW
jgi:hypothetical protein